MSLVKENSLFAFNVNNIMYAYYDNSVENLIYNSLLKHHHW